jgi:hypothetical protein
MLLVDIAGRAGAYFRKRICDQKERLARGQSCTAPQPVVLAVPGDDAACPLHDAGVVRPPQLLLATGPDGCARFREDFGVANPQADRSNHASDNTMRGFDEQMFGAE